MISESMNHLKATAGAPIAIYELVARLIPSLGDNSAIFWVNEWL